MLRMTTGLLVVALLLSVGQTCSATGGLLTSFPVATELSVPTLLAAKAPAATEDEHESPPDMGALLFVFVLSAFIGMGVIGRVSRLLHTPLMSLTNAISAIAVVGSILVVGRDYPGGIRFLGAIALFASMTNIVSGFLLTDRMLKMFKQTRQPEKP